MTRVIPVEPLALAGVVLLLLGACTSAPVKNEQLERARAGFEQLAANADVTRNAANELNNARASLASAEKAWVAKTNTIEVNHRAYLALNDIEIAKILASARSREEQINELKSSQRDAIVQLRSAEAAAANSAAEQARNEAARLMAETEQLKIEAAARESQLQAQLDELNELRALQAKSTDRGMVLTLGDLLFDVGKSTLKPGAITDIDQIATFMQKHPERAVLIEGHTDDTGDEDSNRELSLSRAKAIGGALEARGVDFTRIETLGVGEDAPVASNDTAIGRQLNRRVEIIFPNDK